MGLVPLHEATEHSLPPCKDSEKTAIYEQGGWFSPDTNSADALDLGLPSLHKCEK